MQIEDILRAVAAEPVATAILLDVDGTLAPIAPRPGDAAVPAPTRGELRRLLGRYGLVACISGRPSEDARRVVGVPELTYVGEHGLELALDAPAWSGRLGEFARAAGREAERKPLSLTFHYRGEPDEEAAVAELEALAQRALAAGLRPRFGRKVLEIRPPVEADKGTAVRALLSSRGLRRALYAGDDATDLDAFRALEHLELGVRVAVASEEAPASLGAAADLTVAGPPELLELLRRL